MNPSLLIRKAKEEDLHDVLTLYTQLGNNPFPQNLEEVLPVWHQILAQPGHFVVVAETEGKLVGSCVCQIIPNLTHGMRPYAVIENVVTDEAFRRQGIATACLHFAREEARTAGCYKLMLSTGSKKEGTLRFYEKAGYNRQDKTAFVQWLEPHSKG